MASSRELRVRIERVDYTSALFDDDECEKKKDTQQWALRLFNDFCNEVGISVDVASNDVQSLADALKQLYTGARTKKCQLYQLSAFRSLRCSLKKHFRATLKVDITKDEAFAEANEAYTAMENRIKALGAGMKRELAPIKEKDLVLLKEYFEKNMQNPTPQQLIEYVWFILQYYKGQLAPDSYESLTLTRFIVRTDYEGKKCILPNEFISSDGKGGSKAGFSGSLIPAMQDDVLCPVKAFELYQSKIHEDMDKLFQKPKKIVEQSQLFWFDRVPLGKSALKEMMTTLSENANLSMKYTNQSLTVAAIVKLLWSGIKGKEDPSDLEPEDSEDKSTTVRQVKMKSALSMTIVKKKKRGRPRKPETTPYNKDMVAELLNQMKSKLKTDSTMANPSPIINTAQESQQQRVKLTIKKPAPSSVSSGNNNRPCAPVASPSPRQDPLPPKQTPSKSLTSSSGISNNNNQQSEILTSNKTERCRINQPITNREEKSSVNKQNVVKPRSDEVLRGGYPQQPSSVKRQNVVKPRTNEVLRGGYQETPTSVNNRKNVWTPRADEVLRGGYQETLSSVNNRKNVWTPRADEVLRGGYQETPSSINVQNVRQSRTDEVVVLDEYREPPSRSTFIITDVRSCGGVFTDRNVGKTMMKPIETPTHSYVIHKHQTSMLANMAELWKKGKFCDATIGNGTMKIMVHKIVLLALSPQLLNLSNSDLTSGFFQLTFPQEIGGDALWAFSKYMYEGVVSLNSGVLEDMERISTILSLQDLKDMCNLYRNQVNLPSNTSVSSQSYAANNLPPADTPINLDPLPPSIKSEAPVNDMSYFSPSGGDITQTVSRPVQRLQIMTAESNDPRLQYSSNQSSIGDVNRASEDRTCVTISGSDSDSDLTVVSSNIQRNPVRKRRRQHAENNFLLSKQSPSEPFLNDHLPETWPSHSYGGNDTFTNPSQSKQVRLTDTLVIDDSQNYKISYTSSGQRSNDIPYSVIENLDERS